MFMRVPSAWMQKRYKQSRRENKENARRKKFEPEEGTKLVQNQKNTKRKTIQVGSHKFFRTIKLM